MKRLGVACVCVLMMVPAAVGNPGVGLGIHMGLSFLFGSFLVGLIEFLGASVVWRARWWVAGLVLIVGNYVSGIFGAYTLPRLHGLFESLGPADDPLASAYWASVWLAVLLYPITVAVELPAFRLAFAWSRRPERRWRRAFLACCVTNVVTVGLTLWWFGSVSWYSLYTDFERVEARSLLERRGIGDGRYELMAFDERGRVVALTLDGDVTRVVRESVAGGWWPEMPRLGLADRDGAWSVYAGDQWEMAELLEDPSAYWSGLDGPSELVVVAGSQRPSPRLVGSPEAPVGPSIPIAWVQTEGAFYFGHRPVVRIEESAGVLYVGFQDAISDMTFVFERGYLLATGLYLCELGPFRRTQMTDEGLPTAWFVLIDLVQMEMAYVGRGRSLVLLDVGNGVGDGAEDVDSPREAP